MTNQQAADLLTPVDHVIVRDKVAELSQSGRERVSHVILSRGEHATMRYRPIGTHAGTTGAVVEINVAEGPLPSPQPLIRPPG